MMNKKFLVGVVLGCCLAVGLFLFKKNSQLAQSPAGGSGEKRIVNLATWSNYIAPELIDQFQKSTGIEVRISNYSSNEELLAKLQAGATGFDVAMPSDYMILVMSKLGLLQPLDHAQIPNGKTLSAELLKKPFDPENKYSLPFDWGTTGIGVHRGQYKGVITGWNSLFKATDLAGKFMMLDDVRETIGAALKALGFSINTVKEDELAKAKALLLEVKPKLRGFNSEPQQSLLSGEIAVAHMYSSDALRSRKKSGGQVEYIVPEEGCTMWIDNFVIPAQAPHTAEAHALINFLLDVKSNVVTATQMFVIPSQPQALAMLPDEIKKDPMVIQPKSKLEKCEMIVDLGEGLKLWDRIWTEVKTAN